MHFEFSRDCHEFDGSDGLAIFAYRGAEDTIRPQQPFGIALLIAYRYRPCHAQASKPVEPTTDACQLTQENTRPTVHSMADPEFVHPGVLVRQQCLERFDLNVTQGAVALGVSRQALTNLLGGKAGLSPEMALRLAKAFGVSAETWLQRQVLYDLEDARRRFPELNAVQIVPEVQSALF